VTDWQLPTVPDTGVAGCVAIACAGTDCSYTVDLSTSEWQVRPPMSRFTGAAWMQ
jgi:hypothetical protein